MGMFLFTNEFENKAPELDVVIEQFLNTQDNKFKSSEITKLNSDTRCDFWVNPNHKTSILRNRRKIYVEVMLGQPHDISELFMGFLEKIGGKRKK